MLVFSVSVVVVVAIVVTVTVVPFSNHHRVRSFPGNTFCVIFSITFVLR